jgi:restriction endonuclease S subunit
MISTATAVTTDGDWHNAVPIGWSLKQLKWAVTFQRGHDLPTEDRQEGPVPVVTGAGITGWHNVAQARGPGIVTGRYGTIGEFYLVEQDYWPLNTSLYSIDLHGNHAGFLRYMLEPLAPLFHLNAAKSAVPGIDRSDIHTIPVAVPPLATQRAIAGYLDRETARLDGLVAAKARVLGLLAEKRRALLTRAVTRGLDPCAPLRDSGIPWLGEIPTGWTVAQLRRFTRFVTSGSRGWAEHYADKGAIFVRIGNLTRDSVSVDLSDIQYVDPPPGAEGERTRIEPGDLLFSITAYLGSVAIAPNNLSGAYINQHIALVRLTQEALMPSFAAYVALSNVGQAQLNGQGYGGTKMQLALDDVGALWLPIPPKPEQRAIVDHIAVEIAKLDALRAATERTISLLQERRAALIAAAVTGQLAVEGAV